jgi:hypothetical protein
LSQEARERWQETRESRHPAAHLRGYSGQTAKRWLSTFFLLAAAWPRKKNGLLEPLKNKAFRKVPFLKIRPTFETQKKRGITCFGHGSALRISFFFMLSGEKNKTTSVRNFVFAVVRPSLRSVQLEF